MREARFQFPGYSCVRHYGFLVLKNYNQKQSAGYTDSRRSPSECGSSKSLWLFGYSVLSRLARYWKYGLCLVYILDCDGGGGWVVSHCINHGN